MYNYLYATQGKEEADIVGDSLLKAAGYGIRTGAGGLEPELPECSGIIDQVAESFQTMGNKAANAILGNVTIDRRGIKDSVSHGLGRNKAIAFKAVPQVIRDGKIIDYQKNWKGRGYDTLVLAAPVTIKSEPYYEGVILIRPQDSQRFYLHEVLAANEKDMPAPFKTGTTRGGTSGGAGMPSLISLLNEIRKVNAPEKNIDLVPMEESLLGPTPRGILQQKQGLSEDSISQTAEKAILKVEYMIWAMPFRKRLKFQKQYRTPYCGRKVNLIQSTWRKKERSAHTRAE